MEPARSIDLYAHQRSVLGILRTGSILVGGVGSGKSRVGLEYFHKNDHPKDLYIITTAKKRDSKEWEDECLQFYKFPKIIIDSWHNIKKYKNITGAFFIFDEQKVVGSGPWAKSFIKIAKNNDWILLTATPGDTWMDYIPVFVANGFYKNRTEFIYRHVVASRSTKFFKVDHYVDEAHLRRLRDSIIVYMDYQKKTVAHHHWINVGHDKMVFDRVRVGRWNPFENRPIKDVAELYYTMRKVVNSDPRRISTLTDLLDVHPKVIIFYNFNYELHLLLNLGYELGIPTAQWNGHKHEEIPDTDQWIYLVQYTAGAEGWNCIETDTVVFYSQNYSYKATIQAAGRIDRMNTPFVDLNYYHLTSSSFIDNEIKRSYDRKEDFNELRSFKSAVN